MLLVIDIGLTTQSVLPLVNNIALKSRKGGKVGHFTFPLSCVANVKYCVWTAYRVVNVQLTMRCSNKSSCVETTTELLAHLKIPLKINVPVNTAGCLQLFIALQVPSQLYLAVLVPNDSLMNPSCKSTPLPTSGTTVRIDYTAWNEPGSYIWASSE